MIHYFAEIRAPAKIQVQNTCI